MQALRELGRTGIRISSIGLGCWQFSRGKGVGRYWRSVPTDEVRRIVATALSGGINWFDTAELYGRGASEEALADALQAAGISPGGAVVATKWWPVMRRASHIRRSIGDRLARLSPFPVDLHQVHQPYCLSTVEAQMAAMADLVEAGKVRAVGVSNFGVRAMRRAHAALARRGIPLAANQVCYNLVNRRIEGRGLIAAARELGVTVIAYSPLAQGLLSGRFHDEPALIRTRPGPRRLLPAFRASGLERSRPVVEVLRRVAAAHSASAAQVALAWLTRFHGDTVVAIPGATSLRQMEDNVGALRLELGPDELERIDRASAAFLRR